MSRFHSRLVAIGGEVGLKRLRRGIEREALRVTPTGGLSTHPHPSGLGSPLTHPAITTDFSEAQLELITQPQGSVEACLDELTDIHRFIYHTLDDELLWPASMPCELSSDEDIPIARYGSSNAARVKEIYRRGLGNRYGRVMQTISGLHYNFSIPVELWQELASVEGESLTQAYQDSVYLRLIRNFRKHCWLLIYLFGASPVVSESFLRGREHNLLRFGRDTFHLPFATSLRMGPLGYQSAAQANLYIDYNSVTAFAETLKPALVEPYQPHTAIGIEHNNRFEQLGDAILQIEAEYYGTIRAKSPTKPEERALLALTRRGIQYVELRCIDIDPFEPIGVGAETLRFLDIFLLYAALIDNNGENERQSKLNLTNQLRTVHEGRSPELELIRSEGSSKLRDWALHLLDECSQIATVLDATHGGFAYQTAIKNQIRVVQDPALTPAATIERRLTERKQTFAELCLDLAEEHKRLLQQEPLNPQKLSAFENLASESQQARDSLERSDREPFSAYLAKTLALDELA